MSQGLADPLIVRHLCAQLLHEGLAVTDDVISLARVRALRDCAQQRRQDGHFRAARIGAGQHAQRRERIRGDELCWWAPPLLADEQALAREFEVLRLALNREGLLGLFDLEVHYAWYRAGAGYARHVDQLQGSEQRLVSLILYLNEDWPADAGGQLRIFDPRLAPRDIEPVAGRLVCFLTADREHAVLPTHRDRLSITGWFRRRAA